MEAFTQFDYAQLDSQYNNAVHECSALDSEFRREFIQAINKGALSRCENLLNTLEDGACKQWLQKRLSEMDFESIRSFIVSA